MSHNFRTNPLRTIFKNLPKDNQVEFYLITLNPIDKKDEFALF